VAAERVPVECTDQYGILDPGETRGDLTVTRRLVEKPASETAPSNLAVIGRYILQPDIFDVLEKQERGAGGEIQLTDAINRMASEVPTHGFRFEGKRFDCGNRLGFVEANIAFALHAPDMRERMQEMLKQYQETVPERRQAA